MTVMAIKLVTGEEIIGDASATPEGRISVSNAVTLRMFPSQIAGGQPSMGFQPFPTLAISRRTPMMFEPLHVVYSYVPDEELVIEYNRMFEEGASPQIITG
jgi:hypothetical protein